MTGCRGLWALALLLGACALGQPAQQVIVQLDAALAASQITAVVSALQTVGESYGVALRESRQLATGARVLTVTPALPAAALKRLIGELGAVRGVEYAEEDAVVGQAQ
jgi:hypothetical protein